jgi:hypothetical protein
VALVDLRGPRRNPLAGELADEIADLALLLTQRLVLHAAKSIAGQSLVGQYVARARITMSSNRITSVFIVVQTVERRKRFRK